MGRIFNILGKPSYLGYLTWDCSKNKLRSTHSRNYLGYLTLRDKFEDLKSSTHSRNYLGYLTDMLLSTSLYLHTVEII